MSVPVINSAQMREWERVTWASSQTEAEVIRRVGKRVARRARRLTRSDDLILILAGKGNNGNDARASREFLDGRKIELLEIAAPENFLPALETALAQKPALIIDGLFGIGLNRPLDIGWMKLIHRVNESKIPVLAIDVPSGLNADTGENFGAAIEATITLTVGAPKIGMLAQSAWPFVGRLEVAEDVGLVSCPVETELNWTQPEDFQDFPPRRTVAGHKGSFGHLAIVAGSLGFHGSSVLASRAAQRAQPGLVTLFAQEKIYPVVASQLQAAMVNVWKPQMQFPKSTSAILIGCGLAGIDLPDLPEKMKIFTKWLWTESELPLIVDATALDWIPAGEFPNNAIRVVTPHPGEAAHLLKTTVPKVQANRVESLREISKKFGNCFVVLKGHQTLIGRAEGGIFVNPSGNPHLAQGGSGDVLAGFIAGLLAQPPLQADVAQTIRYAVWQHGNAADGLQAARANWVVEDLVDEIGNVR
ncbi:MAG TPA: NAD(P)H-hydrate dehydratase [Verrucomicrobiae bacterium]|jgi:NAD(P)H-hydrate epimerase|nr:NAD(P)H-hydrate dehydratase [Verrucomicrobiae bacterium]